MAHNFLINFGFVSLSWKVVTVDSRENIPRLVEWRLSGDDGVFICFTFVEDCHHRIDNKRFGHKLELRFSTRITVLESRTNILSTPFFVSHSWKVVTLELRVKAWDRNSSSDFLRESRFSNRVRMFYRLRF